MRILLLLCLVSIMVCGATAGSHQEPVRSDGTAAAAITPIPETSTSAAAALFGSLAGLSLLRSRK